MTYVLLTIVILFDLFNKKKTKLILPIIFSKIFIICILFVFANSFHHFAHSGCFISPIKITCFPKHAFWSVDHVTSGNLAIYVEFWAKGGVGLFKNVTYEMMKEYNSNFKFNLLFHTRARLCNSAFLRCYHSGYYPADFFNLCNKEIL